MIRTCKYCRKAYDTDKESQIFCDKRKKPIADWEYKRWRKSHSNIVKIKALSLSKRRVCK